MDGVTVELGVTLRLGVMVLDGVIEPEEVLPPLSLVGSDADPPEDPVARLRRLIAERQPESVEILRGWMEAAEERG